MTSSSSPLQVTLGCDCGRSVVASTKDAGGAIACGCGRSVAVPSLSQLRTLARRDAFVTNPAEAIEKALRNGENPAGDRCVMCGATNPVVYMCHATCESTYVKGGQDLGMNDIGRTMWLIALFIVSKLFFGLFWCRKLFGFGKQADEIEIRGHDVGASFPLPVCDSCSKSAGGVTRAKVAKLMMAKVPLYKSLIDYYPQLELDVKRAGD